MDQIDITRYSGSRDGAGQGTIIGVGVILWSAKERAEGGLND
jgi:hypothetical protein